MPFCCQCGNSVRDTDVFCGVCGARQAAAAASASAAGSAGAPRASSPPPRGPQGAPPQVADLAASMNPRTASLLCYIPWVGWIPAIVVLASAHFRSNRIVRFHAFQGLYLFVGWLIVDWFVRPFFQALPGGEPQHMISRLFQLVILGAWILMLVKVSRDEHYRLPIVGDLAEKSVSEQG